MLGISVRFGRYWRRAVQARNASVAPVGRVSEVTGRTPRSCRGGTVRPSVAFLYTRFRLCRAEHVAEAAATDAGQEMSVC